MTRDEQHLFGPWFVAFQRTDDNGVVFLDVVDIREKDLGTFIGQLGEDDNVTDGAEAVIVPLDTPVAYSMYRRGARFSIH